MRPKYQRLLQALMATHAPVIDVPRLMAEVEEHLLRDYWTGDRERADHLARHLGDFMVTLELPEDPEVRSAVALLVMRALQAFSEEQVAIARATLDRIEESG